jgi:hypothetical protein
VLAEVELKVPDAVLLHVATNKMVAICSDIRGLDPTLHQHRRLIQVPRMHTAEYTS